MKKTKITLRLALLASLLLTAATNATAQNEQEKKYRAARSVTLAWQTPPAEWFYNELIVKESTRGSYFMACGWNTGYFGIQELTNGKKIAIFSVWDPTKGDDPTAVKPEDRVEILHQGQGVRVSRFGGEGTGGKSMTDFDWEIGKRNRFLVNAKRQDKKTAYSGYLWLPKEKKWKHLVTFRTRTADRPFTGFYSFVEDFRRDFKSVHETRTARFGKGWVRTPQGHWLALTKARFVASGASWEAKENIDAAIQDGWFQIRTGGDIRPTTKLGSTLEIPPVQLPQK